VLYGLNVQARGSKLRGRILIAAGIIGGIALVSASLFGHSAPIQPHILLVLAILSAVCFYKFEKGPVRAAIQNGAALARWWPPALFLAVVCLIILCIP
jgi:hypothetical protein